MHNDDLQDALEVLQSARYWHLPAVRWFEVERPVDALSRAFAADDDKAFRRATTELELLGPVRAASAADPPREPAGERIRERIVELIHTLAIPRPIAEPVPDNGPDPAG